MGEIDTPLISLSYTLSFATLERRAILLSLPRITNETVTLHIVDKIMWMAFLYFSLYIRRITLCCIQFRVIIRDSRNELHCPYYFPKAGSSERKKKLREMREINRKAILKNGYIGIFNRIYRCKHFNCESCFCENAYQSFLCKTDA